MKIFLVELSKRNQRQLWMLPKKMGFFIMNAARWKNQLLFGKWGLVKSSIDKRDERSSQSQRWPPFRKFNIYQQWPHNGIWEHSCFLFIPRRRERYCVLETATWQAHMQIIMMIIRHNYKHVPYPWRFCSRTSCRYLNSQIWRNTLLSSGKGSRAPLTSRGSSVSRKVYEHPSDCLRSSDWNLEALGGLNPPFS